MINVDDDSYDYCYYVRASVYVGVTERQTETETDRQRQRQRQTDRQTDRCVARD